MVADPSTRFAVAAKPLIVAAVMERVLDEISFTAADRAGETVTVDGDYVRKFVGDLAKNADLSRFIL